LGLQQSGTVIYLIIISDGIVPYLELNASSQENIHLICPILTIVYGKNGTLYLGLTCSIEYFENLFYFVHQNPNTDPLYFYYGTHM
jgi:hypothetical protein